jgi:hypothetical protein
MYFICFDDETVGGARNLQMACRLLSVGLITHYITGGLISFH